MERKYKVKIEHISNTTNYGSLMMAINCINKLYSNTIDIYVDTLSKLHLNRLKKELVNINIKRITKLSGSNIICKINNKIIDLIDNYRYDCKIILGGDDISEYYGINGATQALKRIKKISKRCKVILLGQTVGPFTNQRIQEANKVLNDVSIYVRDEKNYIYLNSIGISTCKNGRDLAFMNLPNKNIDKYYIKYNLNNEKYITIVASGLYKSYIDNFKVYVEEYKKILSGIIKIDELKEYKIVLLPHVLLPEYVDDRNIIRAIMDEINDKYKNRIIPIYDEMLASEARKILGNGLFTVTGRMHAAVSTFFMRKPAISLSYSVKYAGVISDGLDMNELVIECANEEIWKSSQVSKNVLERVQYVLDNYEELIKKIDKNVSETTNIVEKELEDLKNELKLIQR